MRVNCILSPKETRQNMSVTDDNSLSITSVVLYSYYQRSELPFRSQCHYFLPLLRVPDTAKQSCC